MSGNGYAEESILQVTTKCRDLRTLNLCRTWSTDIILGSIADNCKELESIDISRNQEITDDGLQLLLQKCTRLRVLGLSSCGRYITNKTIVNINNLCTELDVLDVSDNRFITREVLLDNLLKRDKKPIRLLKSNFSFNMNEYMPL